MRFNAIQFESLMIESFDVNFVNKNLFGCLAHIFWFVYNQSDTYSIASAAGASVCLRESVCSHERIVWRVCCYERMLLLECVSDSQWLIEPEIESFRFLIVRLFDSRPDSDLGHRRSLVSIRFTEDLKFRCARPSFDSHQIPEFRF